MSKKQKINRSIPPKTEEVKDKTESGSFFKTFILTIATGVVFILIFSIPLYNMWFKGQIKGYYTEYKKQKKTLDFQTRWEQRHGYEYLIPNYLAKTLDTSTQVFLMPSVNYLKKNNISANWTDARWFYYMTEKRIPKVYPTDSNRRIATHTLMATPQGLTIIELNNDTIWQQVLAEFK